MSVRLVTDPRDPSLYRAGLSSARAALREGRARRFLADGGGDAHLDDDASHDDRPDPDA